MVFAEIRQDATARTSARPGRAPASSHGALSDIALDLFLSRGFDETTMDDVADAAGVARRTLFRYFPSKNDLPWGDFDGQLRAMRAHFSELARQDLDLGDLLRTAILDFNAYPPDQLRLHRERMRLLLTVPALQAHATLRYAAWRRVIAEVVAAHRGEEPDALVPRAVGAACLGVCLAAYEQWLRDDADLRTLLEDALDVVIAPLAEAEEGVRP